MHLIVIICRNNGSVQVYVCMCAYFQETIIIIIMVIIIIFVLSQQINQELILVVTNVLAT